MAKRPKDKRPTNPVYAAASLTTQDLMSSRYMVQSTDIELVSRMIRNTVARAIDLNATVVAGQPLRLYRPGRASKVFNTRKVGKARHAYLAGACRYKPGRKAVSVSSSVDELEEVTSHPVLDLMYAPEPNMTGGQWFHLVQSYLEAAGWCATWMGEEAVPVGMYVLPPHQTKIDFTVQNYIRGFRYGADTTRERFFPAEQCGYFRMRPHPQNPNRAMSWLSSIIMPSDLEQAALQSEIARWNNGGLPGMIIKIEGASEQADFDRARGEMDRQIRGASKAGKPLFISGAEIVERNAKPHELNYQGGLDTAEARIYRAAGIPEPLWKLNDANLASAASANATYMQLTIWPRLSTLAELLTEYVLRRFDPSGTMFFAYDNPDREDEDKEVARHVSLVNAGLMTGNEARSALGIEVGGEELDVYRFNGMPLAMPVDPEDSPEMPEVDDGEESVEDSESEVEEDDSPEREGTDDGGEGGTGESDAVKGMPVLPDHAGADGQSGDVPGTAGQNAVGDGRAGKPKLTCTCGDHSFSGTGKSMELESHTKDADLARRPNGMNAAIDEMAVELNRWYMETYQSGLRPSGLVIDMAASQSLDRILTVGLDRMFRQGMVAIGTEAGQDFANVQVSDRARQYLNETKLSLVQSIQNTAKERAVNIIADGIEQGKTINEIRDGLGETGITDAMAERVARTETARAYQFGELEGASTTGAFAGRRWALAGGPCALCSTVAGMLAGKVVPYDQPFLPAGTTIATPEGSVTYTSPVWVPSEAHPNCRCASIDVLKDGD